LAQDLFRRLLAERLPVDDVAGDTVFMIGGEIEVIVHGKKRYSFESWTPSDKNNEDYEFKKVEFDSVDAVVAHLVKFYNREKLL